MATDSEDEDSLDLGAAYTQCLNTYGAFILSLGENAKVLDSPAAQMVVEEYGRFKLWGDQTRAALSFQVTGSLSAVVREQTDTRDTIQSILRRIQSSLEEDIIHLQRLIGHLAFDTSRDDPSSDSESSSEDEELGSESDDENISPEPLYVLLRRVYDSIQTLFRMGSLIRESRFTGRYLHSSTSYGTASASQQDYLHVRQKIDEWEKQYLKNLDEAELEEEEQVAELEDKPGDEVSISPEAIAARQTREDESVHIKYVLCRRLAAANTKLRMQFKYWHAHPYTQVPRSQPKSREKNETGSSRPPPTVYSLSSVANSAIIPNGSFVPENDATRTTYAASVVNNKHTAAARLPDVPKISHLQNTFECPYCHMLLPSKEMQNRQQWKRHIFRDIRPYICTNPECSNPDKLFATRYDWTYHESQMHRRQWNCQECSDTFENKDDFIHHLKLTHPNQWTEYQLPVLLGSCERPRNEATLVQCPLCPKIRSMKAQIVHVAEHMEEISLFSFPRPDEDSEDGEDLSKAGHAKSHSTVSRSLIFNSQASESSSIQWRVKNSEPEIDPEKEQFKTGLEELKDTAINKMLQTFQAHIEARDKEDEKNYERQKAWNRRQEELGRQFISRREAIEAAEPEKGEAEPTTNIVKMEQYVPNAPTKGVAKTKAATPEHHGPASPA